MFFTYPQQNFQFIFLNLWYLKNVRILLQKYPGTRFPGSRLFACLAQFFWQKYYKLWNKYINGVQGVLYGRMEGDNLPPSQEIWKVPQWENTSIISYPKHIKASIMRKVNFWRAPSILLWRPTTCSFDFSSFILASLFQEKHGTWIYFCLSLNGCNVLRVSCYSSLFR